MNINENLEYGPVLCGDGKYKGWVGLLDDFIEECDLCLEECPCRDCGYDLDCEECKKERGDCTQYGIVYWGNMFYCNKYCLIPVNYLTNKIPMNSLVNRIQTLKNSISLYAAKMSLKEKINKKDFEGKNKEELLLELNFITELMYEKHIKTRFGNKNGLKLFISHSSIDKEFANSLYVSLAEEGHDPWLDEWNIRGGQSIPEEIAKGLSNADYILVILSPNAVNSEWVKKEWQSMYWDEISEKQVKVIPILLEDCEIPYFLKVKKYIDFRYDYHYGFSELCRAIQQ